MQNEKDLIDIDRLSDEQAEQLVALYRNEWWTRGRTLQDTRAMLRHTPYVFGVCERSTSRLVAFARVLTDRVFKAFVYDVIVAPDYRGRGLGTRLMRRVIDHPELRAVKHLELACLEELETFYQGLGFTRDVGGIRLMRRSAPG